MKISIVMAVSDKADNLSTTIESVLGQTYKNIELILVDNVRLDVQTKLLKEYRERDNRIRLYRTGNKQSVARCLNFGFSVATGDFFMKISDNMILLQDALERIMHVFQRRRNEDFVYTNVFLGNLNDIDGKATAYCNQEIEDIYLYNPARVCFVYKKKVHERINGYRGKNIFDINNDFWIRVKEARFSIYHLKTEVCYLLSDGEMMLMKDRELFLDYRIKKSKEVFYSYEYPNVKIKILDELIGQCDESKRIYDSMILKLYYALLKNPISQNRARLKKVVSDSKATFDMLAENYENEGDLEEPRKCYAPVLKIVKEKKAHEGVKLLDIGCGTGVMLQMICDEFGDDAEVMGIDLSCEMVKMANQNLQNKKAQVMEGTVETVCLPLDFYDIALCMHSFHHYPRPLKSLRHMCKVLHKDGLLILVDNRLKGWKRLEQNFNLFVNNYPYGDMWMYSFLELFIMTTLVGFHKQKYIKVGDNSFIFLCEKK